jgi:hypothetical protein
VKENGEGRHIADVSRQWRRCSRTQWFGTAQRFHFVMTDLRRGCERDPCKGSDGTFLYYFQALSAQISRLFPPCLLNAYVPVRLGLQAQLVLPPTIPCPCIAALWVSLMLKKKDRVMTSLVICRCKVHTNSMRTKKQTRVLCRPCRKGVCLRPAAQFVSSSMIKECLSLEKVSKALSCQKESREVLNRCRCRCKCPV